MNEKHIRKHAGVNNETTTNQKREVSGFAFASSVWKRNAERSRRRARSERRFFSSSDSADVGATRLIGNARRAPLK